MDQCRHSCNFWVGDKMVYILFRSGVTCINYGIDEKRVKTKELSMSEAMELALDIKCDFDYEDVTSKDVEDCIDVLRNKYNILIEDGSMALSEFLTNYANIVCKGNLMVK